MRLHIRENQAGAKRFSFRTRFLNSPHGKRLRVGKLLTGNATGLSANPAAQPRHPATRSVNMVVMGCNCGCAANSWRASSNRPAAFI
jgi:hypothetical protein